MKNKWGRRLVVILLALTMTIGSAGSAMAVCNPSLGSTKTVSQLQINKQIRTINQNAKLGEVKSSVIASLIKGFAGATGTAIVKWGTDKLLNSLFGEDNQYDYMTDMLEVMAGKQQDIIDKMNECSDLIKTTAYQEIVRDYQKTSVGTKWLVTQCTGTLKYIDEQYADKFVDGKLPEADEEQIKIDRLTALTDGIGISNYASATESIDTRVGELYNMFTTIYDVPVGSNTSVQRNFFQVYREKMRLTTHWEHLAYDSMESFNNYMISNFLSAAMLEDASLKARYELCKQQGKSTQSVEVRLKNLYDEVAEVAALYNKNKVSRDTSYRHFWVPDHEVYLLPDAKKQGIPQELTGDAGSNFKNAKGISYDGSKATLNATFWDELWSPITSKSWSTTYVYPKMAGTAEITNLLDGCNHQMTLEQILKEGGISNIPANGVLVLDSKDSKNKFVIDKQSSYMEYHYLVHPKGVKNSQKILDSVYSIPTYEYVDMYVDGSSPKFTYTVKDVRNKNEAYYTLGVKCDHNWEVHWKGLNELGNCTKCGASYINTEAFSSTNTTPTTHFTLKAVKKGFVVNCKDENISGYQIRYSTKSNMKNAKKVTVKSSKSASKKIAKLKAKKKYYVKVRSYIKKNGKTHYFKWTKKSIKTK